MNQIENSETFDHHGFGVNLALAATSSRVIVLHGNRQFDRFIATPDAGKTQIFSLERLLQNALNTSAAWYYDTTDGSVSLISGAATIASLPATTDQPAQSISTTEVVKRLALGPNESCDNILLVVEATLLFADPANPSGDDLSLVRQLEHAARTASPNLIIILKSESLNTIPKLLLNSPFVALLSIPSTNRDERFAYASLRVNKLVESLNCDKEGLCDLLSGATDRWTLERLDRLIEIASDRCTHISDIQVLAQTMITGVNRSPWLGVKIREVVTSAADFLGLRVKAQPAAIESVINTLRRSVMGLSCATQSQLSTAPKGCLFLAGPTGTGKTELVKSLAQLIYGSEANLIRFDCGELQDSVQRLLGAPPGYVGFEHGGELTEAVTANPSSVVLFDEIEKAHPKLLDTLLSVLDDGRLTDGQGRVTYFTDTLVVFTSNLGMHKVLPDGSRTLRFDYDSEYEEMRTGIQNAIADEFVNNLGRPELLGRLGGKEAIIVFDYLRDIDAVVHKFLNNINSRIEKLHNISLEFSKDAVPELVRRISDNPDALALGGRGVAQCMEKFLIDPLTQWLFNRPDARGKLFVSLTVKAKQLTFKLQQDDPCH